MSDALARLAGRMGIVPAYVDQTGRDRLTSEETALALLAAMGVEIGGPGDAETHLATMEAREADRTLAPYHVVTAGRRPRDIALPEAAAWRVVLEDGRQIEGRGQASLPVLPLGLHRLEVGRDSATLLAAPRRLPPPPRCWGLIVPLAGLRDAATGGIGDYDDLGRVAQDMGGLGASYLGINPVHAGFPTAAAQFSPYTPSHRRRLSTIHVPSGDAPRPAGPLIDFGTEIPRRMDALRAAFAAFEAAGGDAAFERYLAREGAALILFATHQALSEDHGPYWNVWPEALRDPASAAVKAAQEAQAQAVRFHAWLQWRAEVALHAANDRARAGGMALGLYLDLAVGTHPYGAETWEDRGSFAFGAALGAPPDAFSKDGQNWQLAPFDPHALIAKGFRPLAETLRRQLSFAGALRIDHILGFDRAFWVPDARELAGAYVQMPLDAMLAVARIEAARAGAVVVGEDLGNIPDGLQRKLAASGILGCRLAMFEKDDGPPVRFRAPERYARGSIASFSTHDLPTWAGWRSGAEITAREALGHAAPQFAQSERDRRRTEVAAFDAIAAESEDIANPDAPDAMHGFLARGNACLAALQIENMLDVEAQPNLPGTVDEYPNWRQRLPLGAGDIARDPRVQRAADIMARAGR